MYADEQAGGSGIFSVHSNPPARDGSRDIAQLDDPFGAIESSPSGDKTLIVDFGQVVYSPEPSYNSFMRTGHCLWALLVSLVAGCFTRWVHSFAVDKSS